MQADPEDFQGLHRRKRDRGLSGFRNRIKDVAPATTGPAYSPRVIPPRRNSGHEKGRAKLATCRDVLTLIGVSHAIEFSGWAQDTPQISSVSPSIVYSNEDIQIYGSGFGKGSQVDLVDG